MMTNRTFTALTALALAGCNCCSRPGWIIPKEERIPPVSGTVLLPGRPGTPCPTCPAGPPPALAAAPAPGVRLATPQAGDTGEPQQAVRLLAPESPEPIFEGRIYFKPWWKAG